MDFIMIIMVAILIEAIVEYAKTIGKAFVDKEYKLFVTQTCTVAIGIIGAVLFHANMFPNLGLTVNDSVGTIITGIILSRGSNYASDLIGRLKKN